MQAAVELRVSPVLRTTWAMEILTRGELNFRPRLTHFGANHRRVPKAESPSKQDNDLCRCRVIELTDYARANPAREQQTPHVQK